MIFRPPNRPICWIIPFSTSVGKSRKMLDETFEVTTSNHILQMHQRHTAVSSWCMAGWPISWIGQTSRQSKTISFRGISSVSSCHVWSDVLHASFYYKCIEVLAIHFQLFLFSFSCWLSFGPACSQYVIIGAIQEASQTMHCQWCIDHPGQTFPSQETSLYQSRETEG